jgi:hypothetical protein
MSRIPRGWRLFLAGLLVMAVWRAMHFLPLAPVHRHLMVDEDYHKGEIPRYVGVSGHFAVRSDQGLLIGDSKQTGQVRWSFDCKPGCPDHLQVTWLPIGKARTRIVIQTWGERGTQSNELSADLPLRSRAFALTPYLRGAEGMVVIFEANGALLQRARWSETDRAEAPAWPMAVLAVGLIVGWRPRSVRERWVALAVVAGLMLRWSLLRDYIALPLEGDAQGFWTLSKNWSLRAPFVIANREPLYIWWITVASRLFGPSEQSLRLISLLVGLAAVPLTFRTAIAFGWREWVGVGAAWLVAINPFGAFMSVQAYQLELFTLLILAFTLAWKRERPVLCAVLGALLCLTRVQSVFAVVPMLAWLLWRRRAHRRQVIFASGAWLILVAPYFITVQRATGSVIGHLNVHAGFYQAAEEGRLGTGERAPITAFGFLRERPWMERVMSLLKGYRGLFFDPTNPYNRILLDSHYTRATNLWLIGFFWIGLGVCLVFADGRKMLVVPLLFLNLLPMLLDLSREPRLIFHIAPFYAILTAIGIVTVRDWIVAGLQNRRARMSQPV